MGIRVGIDLGTTYSAVSRINKISGRPEVIKNSYGSKMTPSVICFQENGEILFGEDAKNMQSMGDLNAIAFFKRSMGQEEFGAEFYGKTYTAQDLSTLLIQHLVSEAEQMTGEKIEKAVITVPAYFTHKEREATISAGEAVGLEVLGIINEPTAAAFAYGLNGAEEEQISLIYDLGGGTFDVTIARINGDTIEVLGSDGNHELGGKDWDDSIVNYLLQEFNMKYGVDLSTDEKMNSSLLITAENIKKQLTQRDEVTVPIYHKEIKGEVTLTNELFEDITSYLLGITQGITNKLIASIDLTWADISGVILVGGSTRMRMIHRFVKDMSGAEPLAGVDVDESVALGAAIRANIDDYGKPVSQPVLGSLGGGEQPLFIGGAKNFSDVTAHALGMLAVSEDGKEYFNSVIIPKNAPIPFTNKEQYTFNTSSPDNELEVYVLQGGNRRPLNNTILNRYVITGIEKVENDQAVIEIAYTYTPNGVVDVQAIQTETKQNLPIRIEETPEDMFWTDASPAERQATMKQDVEILLAIDLSYSMEGRPEQKAKEAMIHFIDQMDAAQAKIGLIAFADQLEVIEEPINDYRKLKNSVHRLRVGDVGIANAAEPFAASMAVFEEQTADSLKFIVVLTDGIWNSPALAIEQAEICHSNGVEVIALGFGGAVEDFLKEIASMEDFASLTDLSSLSTSFSSIAQAIGDKSTGLQKM